MNASIKNTYKKPDIPDGEYVMSIEKIDVGYTKEGAKPRVRFLLQITAGIHKGKRDWKLNMLSTEAAKAWFTEEMKRAGFAVTSSSEFEEIKPELYCVRLRVAVTNSEDGNRRFEILGLADGVDDVEKAESRSPDAWKW